MNICNFIEMWNTSITKLHDLVGVLGVPWAVILSTFLLACVIGSLLYLGYLSLHFGENALAMFLPFMRETLNALLSETTKTHPAIRLELRLHVLFGSIVLISLGATVLHALIPWTSEHAERLISEAFVTSFILCACLAAISLTLSLRLK